MSNLCFHDDTCEVSQETNCRNNEFFWKGLPKVQVMVALSFQMTWDLPDRAFQVCAEHGRVMTVARVCHASKEATSVGQWAEKLKDG